MPGLTFASPTTVNEAVKLLAGAEIFRDLPSPARLRVSPGKGPPAELEILAEHGRAQARDRHRAFHVLELPDVEVVSFFIISPTEKYVTRGLHDPLTFDHSLTLAFDFGSLPVRFQDRAIGLFDLKEQGRVTAVEQQGDIAPRSNTSDSNDLPRDIDETKASMHVVHQRSAGRHWLREHRAGSG